MQQPDLPIFDRRYQYIRSLGQGAQGIVHLARDRIFGNRLVAIKSLRPQARVEWQAAFRHEFEVLAGLSHPRLSQVHDFGTTENGRVYFTRDYVVGDDLKTATAEMYADELVAVLVEVCRALKPLHSRGLLHGDLKPGNIICSPDGVAHLIDFSFVQPSGEDAVQRGTVQYMAPEVIKGRFVDMRADLYSLGIAIYDILSGTPPFEGTSADVIRGHLGDHRPTPVPRCITTRPTLSSDILDGIIGITRRLIARNPDDRFPDVSEVEAAFTALVPDQVLVDPLPDYPVIPASIGLDQELKRLQEWLISRYQIPSDAHTLKVVQGALGTGKTAVLRNIKWWAELNDIAVIETRFGGELLEPIARIIDQSLCFLTSDPATLTIGEHLRGQLTRPGVSGADVNGLMQESALFLKKAAQKRHLLIEISDLEQGSPEAIRVLSGLVAAMEPSDPVVILVASEPSFPWRERLGQGERVALPGLSTDQIAPLVASFFGKADMGVANRIRTHTGGNPLFVMALLRDLAATGKGVDQLEQLGPPRQLEVYWRDKLDTLGQEKRHVVEAAAVIDRTASAAEIARVADMEPDALQAVTVTLEADGWLRRGIDGYHVATAFLANEIRGAIDDTTRIDYHRRVVDIEPNEAKKLLHAARAKQVTPIVAQGREVSRSLEIAGALHAARELTTEMLALLEDHAQADLMRLDLGRICLAQGDYETAEHYLMPLARHPRQDVQRRSALLLGSLLALVGDLDRAATYLNLALDMASTPSEEARAYGELANVAFMRGDLKACAASAQSGLDRAPKQHPIRADLLRVLAKEEAQAGRHAEALGSARDAVSEARLSGDRHAIARAIDMLAWVRQQSGDLVSAVNELERAATLYREIGDLPRLMRDQLVLGDLKWWLESWPEALNHYEEADRIAGAVANPIKRLLVIIGLGQALVKVGRLERAKLVIGEAEQEAVRLGQEELRLKAVFYKGDLLAAQGKVGKAISQYNEARTGFERLCRQDPGKEDATLRSDTEKGGWVRKQAILADIELEMAGWLLWRNRPGDVGEADKLVQRAKTRTREEEGRLFEENLALREGMVAIAAGRSEVGISLLDGLIEALEKTKTRDIAWQAHLVAAKGYMARDADFLARRRLRQAEDNLNALAAGFSAEQRLSFWQDVRRAEVRRLLTATRPSSGFSSSGLVKKEIGEIDQEAQALYRILDINKQLSTERDLTRLLEGILDAAIELTGAEQGLLLMATDQADGRLEVCAARELDSGDKNNPHERFSQSIAESVYLDGDPVVTVDAMGDDRFNEFLSVHELRLKSVACLPVQYRGQTLGVLYLENRLRRGRFGGRDLRVLAAFSDQVAIAIAHARLLEEAKARASEVAAARRDLASAYDRQAADLNARQADLKRVHGQLDRLRSRIEGTGDYHGAIGTGPAMARIFSLIERVKDLQVPVVFIGASGTGKDLLARILHDQSNRGSGPFLVMSCGSLPETLIESTLFGHLKGAFSGATTDRQGLLHAADGGTLYLDEIGDMTPRMQIDLLRVLQEGCFTPLGSSTAIRVNFRLIASSKVPLQELVDNGRLRQDLLYRLQVVTLEIAPLRKRREDILPLVRRFIDREAGQANRPERPLTRDAADALIAHEWPGNVRELEQVVRRTILIGDSAGPIQAEELGLKTLSKDGVMPKRTPEKQRGFTSKEAAHIIDALEQCQWNRTRAAEALGIPRRTFYRKIKRLGIALK